VSDGEEMREVTGGGRVEPPALGPTRFDPLTRAPISGPSVEDPPIANPRRAEAIIAFCFILGFAGVAGLGAAYWERK
jgi:hypothetical protein